MAATAMEMLSEPLSLLLLLTALVIEVLAPVLHYHQFGEAVRTARDAGFSALFTCGIAFAVFPTIRVFRREMETGTYEMALAHPVSRCGFFLAKSFGAFLAFVLFSVTVFSVALVMFKGAAVGGEIASKTGTIVRVYGPFFVFGVGAIILPLAISAALNRFFRCRFVLSSFLICAVFSLCGGVASGVMLGEVACKLLPAALLVSCPAAVVLFSAAAFSVRHKTNAAASAALLTLAFSLPAMDNYYRVESLARGGSLPCLEVVYAVLFALPAVAAFLLFGVYFSLRRE
jgi:ABC-type transport system involved in multi-copper enzyme maturation permease subunit